MRVHARARVPCDLSAKHRPESHTPRQPRGVSVAIVEDREGVAGVPAPAHALHAGVRHGLQALLMICHVCHACACAPPRGPVGLLYGNHPCEAKGNTNAAHPHGRIPRTAGGSLAHSGSATAQQLRRTPRKRRRFARPPRLGAGRAFRGAQPSRSRPGVSAQARSPRVRAARVRKHEAREASCARHARAQARSAVRA